MKTTNQKTKIAITFLMSVLSLLSFTGTIFSQPNSVRLDNGSYFSSIKAAYTSLGSSISAPHVIKIKSTYDGSSEVFPISLPQKSGASAINTITIRPDSLFVPLTVTINSASPFFSIDSADYIIIDGRNNGTGSSISLTLKNQNTSGSAGIIEMKNGATNNTVKFVICYMTGASGLTSGNVIYVAQSTSGAGGNNNNTIERCVVHGGRRGIRTSGTGGVSGVTNNNTVINNNILKNQTEMAIFLGSEAVGASLYGNQIFMDSTFLTTLFYKAIVCQSVGTIDIIANNIYNLYTSVINNYTMHGFWINPMKLSAPGSNNCTINMINNMVTLDINPAATNITSCGIYGDGISNSAKYTANVYNNTFRMGGVASAITTTSFAETVTQPDSSVYNGKNNICINTRTGGDVNSSHTAFNIEGDLTLSTMDYNVFYVTPTISLEASNGTGNNLYSQNKNIEKLVTQLSDTADLEKYNVSFKKYICNNFPSPGLSGEGVSGSSKESHSWIKNVNFISATNSHLQSAPGGDLGGIFIAGVTSDYDNQLRSMSKPYRGADELSSMNALTLTALMESISTSTLAHVQLRNNLSPYSLIYSGNGILDSTGTAIFYFGNSVPANFYIAVKHRNHLETWSRLTQSFSGTSLNYNFSSDTAQAYGYNLTNSYPHQIFCGDIDNDGVVDVTDLVLAYNDAYNVVSGCSVDTDINADEIVDSSDLISIYNNVNLGVSLQRP